MRREAADGLGGAAVGIGSGAPHQLEEQADVLRNRSGPLRSKASSLVTCCQPAPSSPITRSAGMKTRSKTTSLKSSAPARLRIGRMVMPGALRSTRSWLSRGGGRSRRARCGTARSSCAARCAWLVQTLAPVSSKPPSTGRRGCGRGEIGAGIGLAHADAEEDLAAADPGQEFLALRLAAEAQQERAALPVGDPVRRDGGARRRAAPRSRHSARGSCARRRHSGAARSCRSSRARRACG